jgi:hypothetical protein
MHAFAGADFPEQLRAELCSVLQLPEGALRAFWMLLSLALYDVPPRDLDQQVARFAEEHDVEPKVMAGALRAHRFLLREAGKRDLTEEQYADDLATIAGDEERARRLQMVLLPGFEPAMERVKQEIVTGGIADHGKVLTRVKWRVDSMLASDRGSSEARRIGMLTIGYREGAREDRITLQVLPDGLQALYDACKGMIAVE